MAKTINWSGPGWLVIAGGVVGYIVAVKLIERRFHRLPWYKKVLLALVQKLPGR